MAVKMVIAGLFGAPALASTLVPGLSIAGPLAFGMAGFGGTYAVLTCLRPGQRARLGYLRNAGFARARALLPEPKVQKIAVQAAAFPRFDRRMLDGPPIRETARADILHGLLLYSGYSGIEALEDDALVEAALILHMLDAPRPEAGALAALFRTPADMLDLHAQLERATARRALFDAQQAALRATQTLWAEAGDSAAPDMLAMPDPDLYHHILLGADLSDPARRDAVFALAASPETDRASLAGLLARLPNVAAAQEAAHGGKDAKAWHAGIEKLVARFNDTDATPHDLGLDDPAALETASPDLAQLRAALAQAADLPMGPAPVALHVRFDGRAAQPRAAWCLQTLRLTGAPDPAAYRAGAD